MNCEAVADNTPGMRALMAVSRHQDPAGYWIHTEHMAETFNKRTANYFLIRL